MSTHDLNNRLAALAADIKIAHHDVQRGAQAVAERALAAGRMLIEAKAALGHGEWASWLTGHVEMSARTARRYMQIARSGLETATVAEMGIRDSAKRLANMRIRRPPPGYYTEAIHRKATLCVIWRDEIQLDRFHVLVLGRIGDRDHCLCSTKHPVPDDLLQRTVAEAGFPLLETPFRLVPHGDSDLNIIKMFAANPDLDGVPAS